MERLGANILKAMDLPYPKPTSAAATKKMRSNRRSDTRPETLLRSLLHRGGLRFRKDYPIRLSDGRAVHADIAFTRPRLAIFVDGCFWHGCPRHGTIPKSNQDYWVPKLRQNVDRDRIVNQELRDAGWRVLRFWEHVHPEAARVGITSLLDDPQDLRLSPSVRAAHERAANERSDGHCSKQAKP